MPAAKDPIKELERRNKIREFQKGRSKSKETRMKLSVAKRGKKFSEEHRKNLSISSAYKGKHLPEEHRKKIKEALSGDRNPWTGRNHSDKTKKLLSDIGKGRKLSPKHCASLSAARKGEKHWNWQGGKSFEPYCFKFDKPLHERCRTFFDRVCVECGKTETENGQKLSVHHVNYDKMVCCNDVKPLFVALCMSCHGKTHGNKPHWEQHFTEMINTKYNGKCYLPKEEIS